MVLPEPLGPITTTNWPDSTVSDARRGVQQAQALSRVVIKAALHVRHAVRHVVQPAAALGDEPGDLGILAGAAQQLDARLADLEHHRLDTVALDHLAVSRGTPGEAPVHLDRGLEVGNGDADVIDLVERCGHRVRV